MSDEIPLKSENLLSQPSADTAGGKLFETWLKEAQAAPPANDPSACSQPVMHFLGDFDAKQPKAPTPDASDHDWNAYNKGIKEWRDQWNTHVDQFDKMIKYDKLDDQGKTDFKDWLHNVVSPTDPDKPNYLKGDEKTQALEKQLTNPADAQKWLAAINRLEEYEKQCAVRHL